MKNCSLLLNYYTTTTIPIPIPTTTTTTTTPKESFKDRVGCGLDVDWLPVVVGITLSHLFLMLWCFSILNQRLQIAILSLDVKLGGAIQKEIARIQEDLTGNMQPANPLPALLANLMKNQGSPTVSPLEVLKDESGKFAG